MEGLKDKLVKQVLGYLNAKSLLTEEEIYLRNLCWEIEDKKMKEQIKDKEEVM